MPSDRMPGDRRPAEGAGRLDTVMARQGLARSRTHAARLIAEGAVTVDGVPVSKASARVAAGQSIGLSASDRYAGHRYVSRGAGKLIAGLDAFGVSVEGRVALDVGASTGGFTQVLLERGARRVVALDVGHGQLAESIRADPRVVAVEGVNARELTREALVGMAGETPGLVVADLSFISLTTVLPALAGAAGSAELVLLVKPQFEVGRARIGEGVVRDPGRRAEAVMAVLRSAAELGLGTAGVASSPVVGSAGNREYLVRLSSTVGGNPSEWSDRVTALAHAGG